MYSKRVLLQFMLILGIILLGSSFFIIEGFALLYSKPSTTPIWSYSIGNQYVSAVSISSDGSHIVAASEDYTNGMYEQPNGTLHLLNNSISEDKTPLWKYSIEGDFSSLAMSENGSSFVAGGGYNDRKVYLFKTSNNSPLWSYNTAGRVYSIDITENGSIIAATSLGKGQKVFLFDKSDKDPIQTFSTRGLPLRVAISSDGNNLVASDNAKYLYYFDYSNASNSWIYYFYPSDVSAALSISADGNYIVSGGDDIYVFNKCSSTPLWTYQTLGRITTIKTSEDGNYITAAGDSGDNNLYFFNRESQVPVWNYSARSGILSVGISHDGKYVAALSANYWVDLFDTSSSTPIWSYRLDGDPTAGYDYSLEISSDGKYIIAGGRHFVYLFDRDSIIEPKLVIPGYDLLILFEMMGIVFLFMTINLALKFTKNRNNDYINIEKKGGF